jgi:hypothetical protein
MKARGTGGTRANLSDSYAISLIISDDRGMVTFQFKVVVAWVYKREFVRLNQFSLRFNKSEHTRENISIVITRFACSVYL